MKFQSLLLLMLRVNVLCVWWIVTDCYQQRNFYFFICFFAWINLGIFGSMDIIPPLWHWEIIGLPVLYMLCSFALFHSLRACHERCIEWQSINERFEQQNSIQRLLQQLGSTIRFWMASSLHDGVPQKSLNNPKTSQEALQYIPCLDWCARSFHSCQLHKCRRFHARKTDV